MTKRIFKLYQVDSFTKEMFKGNPAGVVLDAQHLSEAQMQMIARELNNSETAFVIRDRTNENYDVRVRFFTPKKEVPICGHATIAAHYVYANVHSLTSKQLIQRTLAGDLPVDIVKIDNDYQITMTQGAIEFDEPFEDEIKGRILCALGLEEQQLMNNAPVQIVSTGHSKVMIGIKSVETLNGLQPNMDALIQISDEIGCNGYYVFTMNEASDFLVEGRMFAPIVGINEDPVTGNANGPLGAYLAQHRMVQYEDDRLEFFATQGAAMGRRGKMKIQVDVENKRPTRVRITGEAVIAFIAEMTLEIDNDR